MSSGTGTIVPSTSIKQNIISIIVLEESQDIKDFLTQIEVTPQSGQVDLITKRLTEIFNLIQYPLTIVYEDEYVDKIYRDTFYTYFSGKHAHYDRNCKKLSLFRGYINSEVFYSFDDKTEAFLQQRFVGICVLKPLIVGKVGRTLLDPTKLNFPTAYVRTTLFKFTVLGHNLSIQSFPYSSQDSETMTCAETTIWNILEYFGNRYPEYKTVLPSHMIRELERISQERILPSRGLDYYTVSELLKTFGFAPRLYASKAYSESNFKSIFHYYVESGIPLAVGVSGKYDDHIVRHSVVCIGHGNHQNDLTGVPSKIIGKYKYVDTADFYNDYVIMDDNQCPFMVQPFDGLTKYSNPEVAVFVVPLYKRVFLEANDASAIIATVLEHSDIGFSALVPQIQETVNDENPLVLRLFLTSSRNFKNFRSKHEDSSTAKYFYNSIQMPRFVWVAELSTYSSYLERKVYGEIILDATSSRMSHLDSLLMVRYLDHLGYRNPGEGFRQISNRIRHKALGFNYPYVLYENNLLKSGESCNDGSI